MMPWGMVAAPSWSGDFAARKQERSVPMYLELDLDVDAGGKVEPHERVDRLRRGLADVDQPLVRADLEVLPRVLVLEGTADDAVDVPLGRQWHWANDLSSGPLRGL